MATNKQRKPAKTARKTAKADESLTQKYGKLIGRGMYVDAVEELSEGELAANMGIVGQGSLSARRYMAHTEGNQALLEKDIAREA